MKKLNFFLVCILIINILILPSISSISDLGTVKKNSCIELPQTCATCSFVNITQITNIPNSQEFLNSEVNLTKTGNRFTYSFCNTTLIGDYIVDGYGDPSGIEVFNYKFSVTNSGLSLTTSESVVYVVLIAINFLVFIFFLYLSIRLPYSNETNDKNGTITKITKAKYLKLLASLFAYGSFFWFFTIFTGILNNFVSLQVLTNIISNLYTFFLWVGVGFTMFIFIVLFIETWKDILLWDQIKKYGVAYVK